MRGELDRIVIGPLVRPGHPGCDVCVAERRAGAREDATEHAELSRQHADRLAATVSPLLTPLAAELAATLTHRQLTAPADEVVMIDLSTLGISRHRFLPDPHCPACAALPPDSPELATVRAVPLPKPDPAVLRLRELTAETEALEALFVDDETGVIKNVRPRGVYAFPMVTSVTGPPDSVDGGYGRSLDYRSARVTALAEALERLGGGRPGGRRTVVTGSHRALGATALDPASVGGHPAHRYAEPGFPFQRYHEELELPWVWGYSFTRAEPVLVPESLAYYRVGRHQPDGQRVRPFVSEISNGCALGSCLEEAALYGLLELAERDAFLLTWYARMPAPSIDLSGARDTRVPLMAQRITARTGYRIEVFDITMEQRVPSFWAMAIDDSTSDSLDGAAPVRPKAFCAAGSALHPERGIAAALQELSAVTEVYLSLYPDQRERAAAMRADPELVRQMDDHALLYCDPGTFDRFDFLLSPANGRRDIRELSAAYPWPARDDLRADLDALVDRYASDGLEVIVVDQTTSVHRAADLACAKVIVPGLLPMTFGHQLRRTEGLPRLLTVPHRLGRTPAALTPPALNPHPHPFP